MLSKTSQTQKTKNGSGYMMYLKDTQCCQASGYQDSSESEGIITQKSQF